MPNLDPSSIGYFKNLANGPLTFSDLTKYRFNSKQQVKRAVQNISMIEHKSVHIIKSEKRRLVFFSVLNGGLSDMYVTNNNEIYSFATIPQYAKLLLSSNAILLVIIIDGTFQSSIYRGSLIIIMTVSSNRTNIPIGWSWGPSENADSIKLILNLIKEVNEHIDTIISDDGKALKAAISEVFPEAVRKLCAWHISKGISNR